MSFRDDILDAIDDIRAIPGTLGLHRHTVTLWVRTWTGDRVGVGTSTITTTPVKVSGQDPHFAEVATQDIVSGLYQSGDFKLGPMTPTFAGGGYELSDLDPSQDGMAREVYYLVTGPDFPGGKYFQKIDDKSDVSTSIFLTLRRTNFTP